MVGAWSEVNEGIDECGVAYISRGEKIEMFCLGEMVEEGWVREVEVIIF